MSIHTVVTTLEIVKLLEKYAIGELTSFSGIQDGITNTNYRIIVDEDFYILTLFEDLSAKQLPFFIQLMSFLADNDIPCPQPIADKKGRYIHEVQRKPAVIMEYLVGNTPTFPTLDQCIAIGETLARMHLATAQFDQTHTNSRGKQWHHDTAKKVFDRLSDEEQRLLKQEFTFQEQQDYTDLPEGIIHADLFPDNTLFLDDVMLTGVIDFYYACTGYYLWDLAVTVNSWCVNPDNTFDPIKIDALLNAYQEYRPLNAAEKAHWPAIRRSAALRFWLSRLHDYHFPSTTGSVQIKDPKDIEQQIKQLLP